MSLFSVFKKHTKDPDDVDEEIEGEGEVVHSTARPSSGGGSNVAAPLNSDMPIEVLIQPDGDEHFSEVFMKGVLGTMEGGVLVVERIPHEFTFPTMEKDTPVHIRGYDKDLNPVIYEGVVDNSTLTDCTFIGLKLFSVNNCRKMPRCPIEVEGTIYLLTDKHMNNPQPCIVKDISTGGACIESEWAYSPGDQLRLKVEVVKGSGCLSYPGTVVRAVPLGNGTRIEYGLLFAALDHRKIRYLQEDMETVKQNIKKQLHN